MELIENTSPAIEFFKHNLPTYRAWLSVKAAPGKGHALIKPLVAYYKAQTGEDIGCCNDCLLEMLTWYKLKIEING